MHIKLFDLFKIFEVRLRFNCEGMNAAGDYDYTQFERPGNAGIVYHKSIEEVDSDFVNLRTSSSNS